MQKESFIFTVTHSYSDLRDACVCGQMAWRSWQLEVSCQCVQPLAKQLQKNALSLTRVCPFLHSLKVLFCYCKTIVCASVRKVAAVLNMVIGASVGFWIDLLALSVQPSLV